MPNRTCSQRSAPEKPNRSNNWTAWTTTDHPSQIKTAGPYHSVVSKPAMTAQFIYTTHRLGRFYPPDRVVLENISLSFYPGAKIGVLGANGAGKSSLLRIMAGLDDGYSG